MIIKESRAMTTLMQAWLHAREGKLDDCRTMLKVAKLELSAAINASTADNTAENIALKYMKTAQEVLSLLVIGNTLFEHRALAKKIYHVLLNMELVLQDLDDEETRKLRDLKETCNE